MKKKSAAPGPVRFSGLERKEWAMAVVHTDTECPWNSGPCQTHPHPNKSISAQLHEIDEHLEGNAN